MTPATMPLVWRAILVVVLLGSVAPYLFLAWPLQLPRRPSGGQVDQPPYRPATGEPDAYSGLTPLTQPIRWHVIAEQYDQMINYAKAIQTGSASAEAILRRFTKAKAIHPTYQAMLEVGRAQKTVFIARCLRNRDLQHEISQGLNVVEAWSGAKAVLAGAVCRVGAARADRTVPGRMAAPRGDKQFPAFAWAGRVPDALPHQRSPVNPDPRTTNLCLTESLVSRRWLA